MKYRRRGVKREHSVLSDFAPVFERLAGLPSVDGVIPGRIAHNPTRHPGLVLKGETATGFKVLAKTTTSVQEAFVIVRRGRREEALAAIAALCVRPVPGAAAPRPGGKGRGPRGPHGPRRGARPAAPRPGVLPAARWQGSLVRFSTADGTPPWAAAQAPLTEAVRDTQRRRLWYLRLRRAAWRRRFGIPARRVPVPPGTRT